ncbi:ATP-dependent helicase [Brevibacillus laterosporus]|uniref:UvrD-helicase domain-containing protein n=1 Tax=Brevibacillus laterosporus TaxID=1465 RepID=UPI00215CB45E|nr:ATP-dependent helicase [Brevibacillus laterosporus]MCR8940023.1 ATP-dependent helicase [Brevibacillus laterosporus]MCZ0842663.1 ATP-dependent helicase [Brevibacillus laterosporus]
MNIAKYNDELLLLRKDNYAKIPTWRMYAKQGELSCPVCGQPVHIVAGISREPFFTHLHTAPCSLDELDSYLQQTLVPTELAATTSNSVLKAKHPTSTPSLESVQTSANHDQSNDVMVGGFRLPKGRSIASPATTVTQAPATPVKSFRTLIAPKQRTQVLEERYHSALHPAQEQAVTCTEGPLLILAGAGSGKTRVMTARTAHLITQMNIDPRSIMVVTFTTKAAGEIKRRLMKSLPSHQSSALIAGTFHSLFYRMLLFHQPERWDQQRLLKQEWQKRKFLRETGAIAQMENPIVKESDFEAVMSIISRWKNEYITPSDAQLLSVDSSEEKQAQELYPLYEKLKKQHGWFDFDDMLIGCYEMLKDDPHILSLYQGRIRYIMIDEFQDINRVQYETVKLLASPENNLCVIGDDDQSIYGFRGSDPRYILGFTADYPNAKTISLEVNYRSRSSIVGLGYSLIGNNRTRWKKELKSFHQEEGSCYLFQPADEEEQASRIVDEMKLRLQNGAQPHQFALLFRTYESTRPLLERLSEADIPFSFTREDEPFYSKQVVRWALGYLRLVVDRENESALREILPTLYLSPTVWNDIRSQSILNNCSQLTVLPELTHLKTFQRAQIRKVVDTLSSLHNATPAHALETIYEDLKLRDYVKKRDKDRPERDQERSTDELRQLLVSAKRHASIRDFIMYIDEMVKKEAEWRKQPQNNNNSVQMLSIHRAKGLEFDTVFLVDVVEGAIPHDFAMDQARQGNKDAIEEERRLMYVAVTRARHDLFIGVPTERFGRKTRMSRFVSEMGRGKKEPE